MLKLLEELVMERRRFIRNTILSAISMQTLGDLSRWADELTASDLMPAMFVGHGSPMNAIENNEFTKTWQKMGKQLPHPKAILCVSAHWETKGTFVTAMPKPKTIHDFGGFPKALFDAQYPAAGSPELAAQTVAAVHSTKITPTQEWGLDHGAWSVLLPMFPKADIPVIQLSIDYSKPASYHYELAQELAKLRKKGVLIVGSGNIVHNLGMLQWSNPTGGYDWAVSFNEKIKKAVSSGNHDDVVNYQKYGREAQLSVPSNEHFMPLVYALGVQQKNEKISFFNDTPNFGSLTMTSVLIGG